MSLVKRGRDDNTTVPISDRITVLFFLILSSKINQISAAANKSITQTSSLPNFAWSPRIVIFFILNVPLPLYLTITSKLPTDSLILTLNEALFEPLTSRPKPLCIKVLVAA